MSIEHHYQNPTTGATVFDDVIDTIRLGAFAAVEDGQLGAAGSGGVTIDDVDGSSRYLPWQRWYSLETACPGSAGLTGTVTKSTTSLTITGAGTLFLAELSPGDELVIPGGGGTDYLVVASVADDTHADVFLLPGYSAAGQVATRAAQQRLVSGWTGPDYGLDRGDSEPDGGNDYDAGRVWALGIADVNTALHFKLTRSAAWTKTGAVGSAVTTGARLAAALATTEAVAAGIFDDGLVSYLTTACDVGDLTNQYFDEFLGSLAQLDGCNFTLDYHEATGHLQLIYQKPATAILPSPLRLSSFLADFPGSLTLPAIDAHLDGAGGGIHSGDQVTGANGSSYVTRPATSDIFEARDIATSDSTLKTAGARIRYGNRQLVDGSTADPKVTCTVIVPQAWMHLIRRYRQLHVAFEALEGWEDCWARILRRDIRHAPAGNGGVSPAFYEVKLVLGPSPVPPVPQASFAVIQYPRAVAPAPGVLALEYAHDGDVPGSFYGGPQPRYGLMAYYDVGAVFAGYHVGIEMTGGGNVDIFSEAVAQFAYDFGSPGGGTFRLDVLLNGVSIGSHTVNDPGSGLHGWSPTADVTLAGVAVVNGDIITCLLTVGGPAPAIQAIPHSGTGSPTWLLISGALA